MSPVETYLQELREIRSTHAGVEETTYYTALANLIDAVGKTLRRGSGTGDLHSFLPLKIPGARAPGGSSFTEAQRSSSR